MRRILLISKTRAEELDRDDSGQAVITVLLVLGTFLLGAIGLATDFSNLWFHKQKAQTAADAACQAGAMDLLEIAEGASTTTSAGFTPGTGFSCSTASGAAPCKYGALNGFSAPGLTANTESNEIAVSFPSTVPGVTAPPSGIGGANPFMRVDVTDRVKVIFSALLTKNKTQDVVATAKCGLILSKSAPPIDVLSPTGSPSLLISGNPSISIIGGPSLSIQVNSNSSSAVGANGSKSLIDLTKAGPSGSGGILGVTGAESVLSQFQSGTPTSTFWDASSPPISDPYAQLATPGKPITAGTHTSVVYKVDGCPDTTGCDEYFPGDYTAKLKVQNVTAIFNPGLYYLENGLDLASNSVVRPSTVTGSTDGTMFYFSGTSSVSVAADSGSKTAGIDAFTVSSIQCPGGATVSLKDSSGNVVTQVNGNILLGACSGTYGDPLLQNRGMLFFQNRSAAAATPSWGGGGQFVLAGNMYFHHCNSTGTGTSCVSTAYDDVFTLQGNSGSGTYVLGAIIADNLTLGGTSGIAMNLNPSPAYSILKAELLQ